MAREHLKFDEIGYWSEVKLDIISEYATAYSTILSAEDYRYIHHAYIDGFAGSGVCLSKTSGTLVLGSPLNALVVQPPFERYFFMDLDRDRVAQLRALVAAGFPSDLASKVTVDHGDCNTLLLEKFFPHVRYEDYWRALCVLDPYGLDLDWEVLRTAGKMKSVDIFLNFPTMAMNRQAFWADPAGVSDESLRRMTSFWGDESWRQAAYESRQNLFGDEDLVKKGNEQPAFRS